MPPPGSQQRPQKDMDSFVAWMDNTLDTNARSPKAGYVRHETSSILTETHEAG
jgi:hypothetical protein